MSEATTEAPAQAEQQQPPEGGEQQQQPEQAKTFDAEYVANLRKEAAKYRTEAKANAEAAKKLQELEDANKTEIQRATDRVAKAEAEVAQLPARVAEQLRTHLVALHEIPADDAELFLTANDPELLLKQVQRLVARANEREQDRKKQGNFVKNEGKSAPAAEGDEHVTVQRLFGG